MAFPTGWTRKCAITIPHGQVGSGGVSSFTAIVTEASLPSEIFTLANTDGSDVRFSLDSAGTTQLALDVVLYDHTNSKAILAGFGDSEGEWLADEETD